MATRLVATRRWPVKLREQEVHAGDTLPSDLRPQTRERVLALGWAEVRAGPGRPRKDEG